MWLRAGRAQKKLSLEDVAKITKIQARILDKLERGELDGLPAEVFVKGFVRSFAKCVGLDEQEAITRYVACKSPAAALTAKALVESMGLARKAQGTPATPTPVVAAQVAAVVEMMTDSPAIESPAIATPAIETPLAVTPVVIDVAPLVAAPSMIEATEATAASEPNSEAPMTLDAPVVLDSPVVLDAAPVVESMPSEQPQGKKKRSRKKNPTTGAPRTRKKKNASAELASTIASTNASTNDIAPPANGIGLATTDIDDDAHTTQIVKISLDTGPVARVDAESLMTSAIEAKTDDAIFVSTTGANNANTATNANDATSDAAIAANASLEPRTSSDGAVDEPRLAEGSQRISSSQIEVVDVSSLEATADSTVSDDNASEPQVSGAWQPTMPPLASTPSVPWRRPSITASRAYVVPTLVIDDADPDSADREREDRSEKDQSRLSFLPPILLDREDRSSRQGGLTLAVIILLIAATLTLSYLMRRPSPSGDGVTMIDSTSQLLS
ncbi:MAG TPA: helix-turn-helix domain-containing protein [Kofleriaceae bacterium]|nr:helix-turn-helix domain-containing protein [Kofleriaceae bacterium]